MQQCFVFECVAEHNTSAIKSEIDAAAVVVKPFGGAIVVMIIIAAGYKKRQNL